MEKPIEVGLQVGWDGFKKSPKQGNQCWVDIDSDMASAEVFTLRQERAW